MATLSATPAAIRSRQVPKYLAMVRYILVRLRLHKLALILKLSDPVFSRPFGSFAQENFRIA